MQYDGSGTTNRSWLHADERGSIIAVSNGTGAVTQINKYDEYGKPQSANVGLVQYTGQVWLSEIGAYYYKARFYSPAFGGRFLQTDPIGAAGGINLYAYVLNDPVNSSDPTGLKGYAGICTGWLVCPGSGSGGGGGQGGGGYGSRGYSNGIDRDTVSFRDGQMGYWGNGPSYGGSGPDDDIVVTRIWVSLRFNFNLSGSGRAVTPHNDTYCEGGGTSTWAIVADYAETIGAAADAGALGAAGIGLVLAPTGAGFAAAELTALGLKGVAFAANATAAVANWQAGNNGRAVGNLVGAAAGAGVGSVATRGLGRYYASGRMFRNLSAGQVRYANYGGDVAGAVAGDAASGAAAAGCNAIRGG